MLSEPSIVIDVRAVALHGVVELARHVDEILAAGIERDLQRRRERVELIGERVETFAAAAREIVGVIERRLQRREQLRFALFELREHPIEAVDFALALFEQIAERGRIVPAGCCSIGSTSRGSSATACGAGVGSDETDRTRRRRRRHDLDRRIAGERRGDQEARVARHVDAVVDRHDHVDREVFGQQLASDRRRRR